MPRFRHAAAATTVAALTALALAGCSSAGATDAAGEDGGASDASGSFPVTIEHAFGETTIEAQPERVATVSWSNQEVPIALGVVPVGMAEVTWGDDDADGVLPWVEEKLEELGAETPVLFDETDGIDFEAVADTQPDVILAAYSGLTQEEYDTLSKIAPVVAYPEVAWGTSYEDMIRLNATALGLGDEGEALIEELQAEVETALAQHPALAESTVLFSYIDPSDFSQVGFYTSLDTRPGFLTSLGLPEPAVVTEESEGNDAFFAEISAEEADRFADVDVFVTYGDASGSIIPLLQADPLLSQIPAIAEGRIAILEESTPLAASANPSPLSIGWGIDEYFALLAGALD
ncbi:iron-siderophore ABC transporter substrate-binding protein [Microbacterium sp. HD4P20]|uniref:iron-siderophore ABC transporter substrate-binding protein n=1 Tax=Microbacterium sp. HD4P20 TaxID=2864874 RepID=UPI001C63D751|nr:iron-siderophore ABC transporter substrate-binding protein [Microbacterium sp. HD4P20]MCP2637039.1 iron-siderophore ABC transporter substrate-binding protein [Microbacterium sp. HD4P20]